MKQETVPQKKTTTVEIIDSISKVSAPDWNHLVHADYPFLHYEFLHALENSGCVAPATGWVPQHILIRNATQQSQELIGAAPLYLKGHSWGEFIFDWDWAHSYQTHGLDYYPKLISQTPFTPLTSPKLLVVESENSATTRQLIARVAREIARQSEVSSMHWHFISEHDSEALQNDGFSNRCSTIEYIWTNDNYRSMDDFLNMLASRKRKKIRSERRSIREQGIAVTALSGAELTESHWHLINRFYQQTVDKYYSHKYLSFDFFKQLGETMPENLVFILGQIDQHPVAGSFCIRGGEKLYGRYWGTLGEFRNLHFEICYYKAIEYCIEHGLQEYNAGVQGEHKLNRGFLPRPAKSSHAFFHPAFTTAIGQYIDRESARTKAYCKVLERHSPYTKNTARAT